MTRRLVLTGRIDEYGTFLYVVGDDYCTGPAAQRGTQALGRTFEALAEQGSYDRVVRSMSKESTMTDASNEYAERAEAARLMGDTEAAAHLDAKAAWVEASEPDFSETYADLRNAQGWSRDSEISLALEFIRDRDLEDDFLEHLREQAADENEGMTIFEDGPEPVTEPKVLTASDIVAELPKGYRWAEESETERWTELAGLMVQVRTGGTDDDPETDLAIQDFTGTWWVYIERDQGRKDMAIGPYSTEAIAISAANESMFVEGEMTSRDGGTDCYAMPHADLPDNHTEYEVVLIDPDQPDFFGTPTYVVVTAEGERRWTADDEAHAREQHLDAHPDEPILSVRLDQD